MLWPKVVIVHVSGDPKLPEAAGRLWVFGSLWRGRQLTRGHGRV